MINRTKSAPKAPAGCTRDERGQGKDPQCDEDDYGYESTAAGGFYEKIMAKFDKETVRI